MVLLRDGLVRKDTRMKKQIDNESLRDSRYAKLNILFARYKEVRDENAREALRCEAYNAYSYDSLCWRFSSWPTSWVDEVRIGMQKKIDDAIADPGIVTKKFSGYLYCWLRSFQSSVKAKRSREIIGLPQSPDDGEVVSEEEGDVFNVSDDVNETRDSDRRTPATALVCREKEVFMHMLWSYALSIEGIRGDVFRLYLKALEARGDVLIKNKYKYKNIASQLNIDADTVASHIHRGKLDLRKRFWSAAKECGVFD